MKKEIYDSFYYDKKEKQWKTENFHGGLPPKPSIQEVNKWCQRWNETDGNREKDCALEKLFRHLLPENQDFEDVLIKACTLNDFYSTNIYDLLSVSRIIVSKKLDSVFEQPQAKPSVVDELSKEAHKKTGRHIYSFTTKYFSHHRPDIYPIYDSYVDKLLRYYRDTYNFSQFHDNELSTYEGFYGIYTDFINYFELTQLEIKEIDEFLWQVGKYHFPKYKKETD